MRRFREWLGGLPWALVLRLLPFALPAAILLAGGIDRRWMDDDGFINLRIIRNWLAGDGPVFNPGERVEAATSPLWLAIVALAGRLGFRLEYAAVYGGIALTVAGLLLAESAAWRLQRPEGPRAPTIPSENPAPANRWELAARVPVPVGALVYAVLPPAWDYASSGLETGLALCWLGGSYRVLVGALVPPPAGAAEGRATFAKTLAGAVLLGLGPLVRPEMGLASGGFLLLYLVATLSARRRGVLAGIGVALAIGSCAALLPAAYQVFRMGYYGAWVPNTALAKEAFLGNPTQGFCYFKNFFVVYRTAWPAAALAILVLARLATFGASRRWLAFAATLLPLLIALGQIAYVVQIGGDYMHGRMFLPPVFAALLPIAVLPLQAPVLRRAQPILALAGCAALVWCCVCAGFLRVGAENECGIGDERTWYAHGADKANPITLPMFQSHNFYKDATDIEKRIRAACPGALAASDKPGAECRRVYLNDGEQERLGPSAPEFPIASSIDPRVKAVATAGAIGISGYRLPSSVHVNDLHGLADPIGSRLLLTVRSRPGHDKRLPVEWTLARFSEPSPGEDAAVAAARHALGCSPLRDLMEAVSAPLSWDRFFHNLREAKALSDLRMPVDPFEADERFCGIVPPFRRTAGGGGGTPYRWRCPPGLPVMRFAGDFDADAHAVERVRIGCGDGQSAEATSAGEGEGLGETPPPAVSVVGPLFGGMNARQSFAVACPRGADAVGIYGTADHIIRSLGLICAHGEERQKTSLIGERKGTAFDLRCLQSTSVVGIEGRSGDLVDAVGIACQ
jgi:arabinofuranosyltransferase